MLGAPVLLTTEDGVEYAGVITNTPYWKDLPEYNDKGVLLSTKHCLLANICVYFDKTTPSYRQQAVQWFNDTPFTENRGELGTWVLNPRYSNETDSKALPSPDTAPNL